MSVSEGILFPEQYSLGNSFHQTKWGYLYANEHISTIALQYENTYLQTNWI